MRNTKLKKGFTLTELVVVIAIIAILILVVVPTFNNIVKNAEGSAALSQAKDLYGDYVRANSKEGKIDNDLYIQVDEGYVHYIDGKPVQNEDESYVVNVLYVNDDLLDNKGKYVESPFKTHESIVAEFVKDFNSFSYKAGYRTYYKNISDYWKNYNTVVTKELVNINKNDVVSTVNIAQGFWEKSALDNKNYNFDKWSWLFEALGNLETETTLFKDLTTNKIIDENNLEIISQNITLFFLQTNGTSWNSELNGELTVNPVIDCASVLFENYFKLIPRDVFLNNINVSTPIFNINFDLSGGEWHDDDSIVNEYQEGELVTLEEPIRNGYIFTGWNDGENDIHELTMPGNDISLTATWKTIEYEIHFDSGEVELNSYSETINNVIQAFLKDYNGFSTNYWNETDHSASTFYELPAHSTDIKVAEIQKASLFLFNSTYKTKWTWLINYITSVASSANKKAWQNIFNYSTYNKFNEANGNYIYSIAYELRGFVGQKKYTKNANYHTADYSNSEIQNKIYEFNIPDNYIQNYDFESGSYTIESEDVVLPTPTKQNYNFIGWYTNSDFSGDALSVISKGTTGDMTLYAKWEKYTWTGIPVSTQTIATYSNICPNGKVYFCDTRVISYSHLLNVYKILLNFDSTVNAYKVVAVDAGKTKANDLGVTWTHAICHNGTNITSWAKVGQYIVIEAELSTGMSAFTAKIYNANQWK